MQDKLILNTFGSQAHWIINKKLVKYFESIDVTLYLSNLISWYNYFKEQKKLDKNSEFYTTIEKIEEETYLNKTKQIKILKVLRAQNIVETQLKGVPAKQYKKINFSKIYSILSENVTTKCIENVTTKCIENITTSSIENITTKCIENITTNNNNKYNNNKYNKISKDIITESKDSANLPVFKSSFTKECTQLWNSISYTQNIRITKRSKTIIKLEKYIRELRNGTFLQNKEINSEWFKKHRITELNKKYKKKDILQGIRNVSLYHKEGYWNGGGKLPKNILELMYNFRQHNSWFLKALHYPPQPISNTLYTDNNPEISSFIEQQLNGEFKGDRNSRLKLIDCSKSFVEFCRNIPEKTLQVSKIDDEMGDPVSVIKEYLNWIEHHDWVDNISLGILNTDNKLWSKFIKDKEIDYQGYKLTKE